MVLDREQLPGATEARLHFVAHEQDAVLVADFPDAQHELGRTRHVAAFAEDGLEDHCGDVARSALLAQSKSSCSRQYSTLTPCSSYGNGQTFMPAGNGPKPAL